MSFKEVPNFHSSRQSSASKISFVSAQITTTTNTQTTSLTSTQSSVTTASLTTTKAIAGLFESNQLVLMYTDNQDSTDFVITSKSGVTTNVYYSFGLSNDMDMVNYT